MNLKSIQKNPKKSMAKSCFFSEIQDLVPDFDEIPGLPTCMGYELIRDPSTDEVGVIFFPLFKVFHWLGN